MANQVQFGSGQAQTGDLTAGAIFGLDAADGAYPLPMPGTTTSGVQFDNPFGGQHVSTVHTSPNMGTVLQGVSLLYQMKPADRADAINQMIAAGYLGKNQAGDPTSVGQAWRGVVIDAARSQVDILTQLRNATAMNGMVGGNGGQAAGNTYIGDPAELADTIDKAAHEVLGRNATQSERAIFVKAMQAQQRKQSALAAAPGGGQEVQSVSPDAQAEEFARGFDPQKADARKVVASAGMLVNMLKGTAS